MNRRTSGAVLLLCSLLCLLPAAAQAPPPRRHYYLTTTNRVGNLPQHDWRKLGIELIVVLHGYQDHIVSGTVTPAMAEQAVQPLAGLQADVWFAFWVNNGAQARVQNWATFEPWDNDADWERINGNLANLARAAGRLGVRKACWDSEIYTGTPQDSGGRMNWQWAWRHILNDRPVPQGLIARRGKEMAQALVSGGCTQLGTYVWASDALRFPGFREFTGGAVQGVPGSHPNRFLLHDEGGYLGDFVGTGSKFIYRESHWRSRVEDELECGFVPGASLTAKKARDLGKLARGKPSFWYDWGRDLLR